MKWDCEAYLPVALPWMLLLVSVFVHWRRIGSRCCRWGHFQRESGYSGWDWTSSLSWTHPNMNTINFCRCIFNVYARGSCCSLPVVFEAQGEEEEAERQQDATGEQRPHHSTQHRGERPPWELRCLLQTHMNVQTPLKTEPEGPNTCAWFDYCFCVF